MRISASAIASSDCRRIKVNMLSDAERSSPRIDQPKFSIAVGGVGIVAVAGHTWDVIHNGDLLAEDLIE